MATRFEYVAQVVRRRHAVAAERRRLLTHALHSDLHRPANDDAADAADASDAARDAAREATERAREWSEQMSWADVTAPFERPRARGTIAPPVAASLTDACTPVMVDLTAAAPVIVKLTAAPVLADASAPIALPASLADGSAPAIVPPAAAQPLSLQIERLRVQAAACRAQAIALNAKLVLLEADRAQLPEQRGQVHAARTQLIDGSARLDHAIQELDAVSVLEQQLASLE